MKKVKILVLIIAIMMVPRIIYAVDEVPGNTQTPEENNENIDNPTNPEQPDVPGDNQNKEPNENTNGNQNEEPNENTNGNQNENQGEEPTTNPDNGTDNQQTEEPNDNKEKADSDSSLKSLALSSGTISFSKFTFSYNVEIPSNVSNLKVTAVASSEKANIKYNPSDSVDLKYGETKTISVIVTAQDGSSTTYSINATRKNLDNAPTVISTKSTDLKSLTIEGIQFNFEPDKVSYSINVPNDVEEVVINYELADSTSTVKMDGDTKLKEGRNKIKITVTSKDGKTKTYTLNITRNKTRINVRNDEEEILEKINSDDKSDLYVTVDFTDEKIISKEILDALSKTTKELSYEVLNDNREIIYSVILNGKNIQNVDSFNYQLSFISSNDDKLVELIKSNKYASILFNNNENFKGKVTLKVYVGDRNIKEYKTIDLYEFTNNKLKLVEKKLKIEEGYVELTIDANSEYVLTNLEKQIKPKTSYAIPVVILLTLLVIVIIGLLIKRRNSKKDTKKQTISNIENK